MDGISPPVSPQAPAAAPGPAPDLFTPAPAAPMLDQMFPAIAATERAKRAEAREIGALRGEVLKERGRRLAAQAQAEQLTEARSIAITIAKARESREVCSDDVQEELEARGIDLGNAAGSIFLDPRFTETDKFIPSRRPSAHGRRVRVWRYIGGS